MVDAVADPVRARLVRRLASSGPASLEDLAKAAGVHPNTARAQLVPSLSHFSDLKCTRT